MERATGPSYRSGRSRSPEIIPPGQQPAQPEHYYEAPPQRGYAPPPRPRRSHWAMAPATYTLVGINCLVYLVMSFSGVSWWNPTGLDLLHWGADQGAQVFIYDQWWRLFTAMFVHAGIIHIAGNMWCLWNLGLLGEPLIGPLGIVAVYILTGLAGDILSTAIHPIYISMGASGAIMGIAGVLVVLLKSPYLPVPQFELKKLRRSVIYFAVLTFILGTGGDLMHFKIQIDNMAHMGGFVCGILMGLPMVPLIGAPREMFFNRRRTAIILMSFVLMLMTYGVYSFYLGHPPTLG
jgi:rhomboid protease GluP